MRNRSAVVRSGGGHGRRRPPWHWHPRALACRISRFRPRNTWATTAKLPLINTTS
uniref:Uncharacterized protein n=1 Tax=Oryza meridionalis TaxID=40149 RepID=A0A0E0FCI5_9ORYZ